MLLWKVEQDINFIVSCAGAELSDENLMKMLLQELLNKTFKLFKKFNFKFVVQSPNIVKEKR